MKIYVDKIPPDGLELSEKIDPAKIQLDLNRQGIILDKFIDAKERIEKIGREVLAAVSVEAPVEYSCARCLAKFNGTLKKEFNVSYEANQGDVLEIDEDIRQEIILDSPIKVVCKPDCKGLCPNCGQNLNIAQCECK